MMHFRDKWKQPVGFLALVVLGATLYVSPRWQFFHSIDVTWIRALQSKPLLPVLWEQFSQGSPSEYRPLTSVYLLGLQLFFDDWAPGFYAANLLLHICSATLVYAVALRLALSQRMAAMAALIFVVHPAPFRTFLWISDGATLLQTHFTLWEILLLLRYFETGRGALRAGSALAAVAAMFTKESGVTAVFLIPLLDLLHRRRPFLLNFRLYLPLLATLVAYLILSLPFKLGWREYPEVFGIGTHIFPNLLYSLGFLLTTPSAYAASGFPWTSVLRVIMLIAIPLVYRDRASGVFITLWLILGALPTALFVSADGFATTGRYTYSFLAPFALAAGEIAERLSGVYRKTGKRWTEATGFATVTLVLVFLSVKTAQLARAPYETTPGPIIYHYIIMALVDYQDAERFLQAELGCPSAAQSRKALDWAISLVRAPDARFQVSGLMVAGVARAMLGQKDETAQEFTRAIGVLQHIGKVELVRGVELRVTRVREVAALWTGSPPIPVCP